MKLAEVSAYVLAKTGLTRSRATIYNWATKGVKVGENPEKLQTEMRAGQITTRPEWVDTFLAKIDQR